MKHKKKKLFQALEETLQNVSDADWTQCEKCSMCFRGKGHEDFCVFVSDFFTKNI